MSSERRCDWLWLAIAILARVTAVLVLRSHLVPNSTYEHGEIAANVVAGKGFSTHFLGADGPTSQQAPVYPLIVAGCYAVGGVGSPRSLLLLELGQAVLGGCLVAATILLAREVAPARSWTPRAAGAIVALSPTLIYAATHVQVALLVTTLLTTLLAAGYRAARTLRTCDSLVAGVWLGILTLTDPILALGGVGAAWAIISAAGTVRRAARPLACVALAALLVVAPWIARNYRVHHELVFVKSTFGYAFWQGNCSLSEGTDKVVRPSVESALAASERSPIDLRALNNTLWAARHEAGYLDDVALSASDYQQLGALPEPQRSRILFRRAVADLRREPARYFRLCARRFRYFWLFDETNPKTRNLVYRSSLIALTLAALFGLSLAPLDLRRRLAPTFATAALISLFHTLTIVSARFHIPIEPMMAVWAASGLATSSNQTRSKGSVDAEGVWHRLPAGAARGVRNRV